MNPAMKVRAEWRRLKEQFPDALVLLELGDFYEAYEDNAEIVADVCGVSLSERPLGDLTLVMAGIPSFSVLKYVEKLVSAGYRVVLADRVEQAVEYTPHD